ncbi:MAG: hypothetical protein CVU39_21870 [Chloroflexi bacterium HGW-Chloroflexi-10]|nr:MAG: hypothetical protein CVU39_21870 [Chloroflexi bacterium HGW-Chloroflexi-10]
MITELKYTVGFLTFAEDILLLLRNNAPNAGKWNGIGGHIEVGESAYQCMQREIMEEANIPVAEMAFGGILTWDGFEIPPGGLYIFSAAAAHRQFVENGEGTLAWHSRQFAFNSTEVVDNIHIFLPPVLAGATPLHYHFVYDDGLMAARRISTLPAWVDIYRPYIPGDEG